jgi:hypothetical protein
MSFPIAAKFAHPENGYAGDQKRAAEHLEPGKVYCLRRLDVDRSRSYLELWDFPGIQFNAVMFDAADWPDFGEGDGAEGATQ